MIAKKILKIMEQIGPIIKDKTNEEKGFDYASHAAIIIKAREAMIAEKVIMIPQEVKKIIREGNDVTIEMIYRFYDTEPDKDGKNDFIDTNVLGEGNDSNGWAIYKALSGAYKYAITQTFAIPTVDDAEKTSITSGNEENINEQCITENGALNEEKIENMLDANMEDVNFDKIFELGNIA